MDVVRHYLVTERYFPDTDLHRIYETCYDFSTTRCNLHDLGRIVSSHARSCVEDMTTGRLGLLLRPTYYRLSLRGASQNKIDDDGE